METILQGITNVYIHNGKKYSIMEVNTIKELKTIFLENPDIDKYFRFRNNLISLIGDDGNATIEIAANNCFKALSEENVLLLEE